VTEHAIERSQALQASYNGIVRRVGSGFHFSKQRARPEAPWTITNNGINQV
jgi:hypothetical protein